MSLIGFRYNSEGHTIFYLLHLLLREIVFQVGSKLEMMLVEFRITLCLILTELLIDIVQQKITVANDMEYILLTLFLRKLQCINNLLRTGNDVAHILGITSHTVKLNLRSCSQRKQEQASKN